MVKLLSDRNIGYDFKNNKPFDWEKLSKKKTKEIEKYYLACILSNNLGDISRIEKLPYADLWTYSFPCQDISVAGKQAGIKLGTRSGLLYEVERLLMQSVQTNTKPKFLLLENVKNLVGKKHIDDFNKWLNKLNELGYNTYWKIINGKENGVPQNRERVFALSIRKDIDTMTFDFIKPYDNGIRLKDLLEEKVDDKYYLKNIKKFFIKHSIECEQNGQGFRFKPHNPTFADTAFTITTRAGGRMDDNYVNEYDINNKPFFEFTNNNINQIAQIYGTNKEPNPQAGRIYDKNYISPTLDSCSGGNRMPKILEGYDYINKRYSDFYSQHGYIPELFNPYNQKEITEIAPTQTTQCGSTTSSSTILLLNNLKIRKLTEKECWRLMGFDDKYIKRAKDIGVSSSQLYKQAGNSIITYCIRDIIKQLYISQHIDY